MNAHRRSLYGLAALAVMALALVGCTKKITNVDASYTAPEGVPSADARLIVYPDAPMTLQYWIDNNPPGVDPTDVLQRVETVDIAPGTLHGMIVDGTPASAFQVLRRETNGGYGQLKDFVLNPVNKFLESQWEIYTFADPQPTGFDPPSYVGRGVVAGQITPTSPLTNAGEVTSENIPSLTYTGPTTPPDSLITMKWNVVPGAVGYWMQVYQFRQATTAEQVQSAQASPFATNKVRNYFVGFVPAPADSYKIGLGGALVLARRTMLTGIEYLVRVTAVNSRGEIVGFTYGDWGTVSYAAGFYYKYRLGAVRVTPTRPTRP